jgi:predicted molibdopterin-dependent oxidoreductase YjgC
VDEGRLSDGAHELKAALEEEPFVEVHPDTAGRLGLAEAATRALVTTAVGEAELPIRLTTAIAPGAAFVPFNQPGLAANTLLSGAFTTSARLTAAEQPADRPEHEPEDEEVSA